MGYFFAQKLGFRGVVVDYRRTAEEARFPSGGEDVAGAGERVQRDFSSYGVQDLCLMPGGIRVVTFMLEPVFASLRTSISPNSGDGGGVRLRRHVSLSAPLDFINGLDSTTPTLKPYNGDRICGDCPLGLQERFQPSPPDSGQSLLTGTR